MNDPRRLAASVVGRVLRSGAYSNVLLAGTRSSVARALVYDVIEHLEALDRAIERASRRAVSEIEPEVLDVLRVSTAELARAARPRPVVVDAGVEAVKRTSPRATGFANAVLRRVDPPSLERPVELPAWLRSRLEREWGADEVDRFALASARTPQVGIRIRPGDRRPDDATGVDGIPEAALVPSPPRGAAIQDPASVAVVEVAAPRAGERVLEIGAAPGGKTAHLVDLAGPEVVALDVHPRRARTGAARVPTAAWVVGDGVRPPFPDRTFDLVLIDAPCSGLGTLRRRPELRLRVTEDEVRRLSRLQSSLVDAAMRLVAERGRVVYSVCTVTPEETVAIVEGRGRPAPGIPGRTWGDGTLMAPHLGPTDGMYVSVLEAS